MPLPGLLMELLEIVALVTVHCRPHPAAVARID
jgi:hypothetical protein